MSMQAFTVTTNHYEHKSLVFSASEKKYARFGQIMLSIDWHQVWNSGEITDDLHRMIGILNTALVARMVIEEVISPEPPEEDTFTWPI